MGNLFKSLTKKSRQLKKHLLRLSSEFRLSSRKLSRLIVAAKLKQYNRTRKVKITEFKFLTKRFRLLKKNQYKLSLELKQTRAKQSLLTQVAKL